MESQEAILTMGHPVLMRLIRDIIGQKLFAKIAEQSIRLTVMTHTILTITYMDLMHAITAFL